MESKKKIVVVGSNMMDFVCYAPRLPKEGETLRGTKFETEFGGKSANQCIAAARLGAQTVFVSRVGDDIFGEQYLDNLKECNIDTKYVWKTPGSSNGVAQIIVSEAGQNQIVIVGGANEKLNVDDIKLAKSDIEEAAVLVCCLETSADVAIKAMELSGSKTISILNGAPALENFDERLLKLPTIFCVNETEAVIFTKFPIDDLNGAADAVTALLKKGCKSVILTLGRYGSLYASQQEPTPIHIPCSKVICVSSTGAGDVFIGALAYLLAYKPELGMREIIAASCFVASDSVTRAGTQRSFPGMELLEQYFGNL